MMIVTLALLAMFCGFYVGMVVGILAGYVAFQRDANDSIDLDYSGGM